MKSSNIIEYVARYSQTTIKTLDDHLEIKWPQHSKKFHYQWLRDHCQCSECKHPTNLQKLHTSGDINLIVPKAEIINGNLQLHWPQNSLTTSSKIHKTVYSLDCLRKSTIDDSRNHAGLLWDTSIISKSSGLNFSYPSVFTQPIKFKELVRQLNDYGLVFISNVPTDDKKVENVALNFGNIRETFYGSLSK